jgi:hypothetical protein
MLIATCSVRRRVMVGGRNCTGRQTRKQSPPSTDASEGAPDPFSMGASLPLGSTVIEAPIVRHTTESRTCADSNTPSQRHYIRNEPRIMGKASADTGRCGAGSQHHRPALALASPIAAAHLSHPPPPI